MAPAKNLECGIEAVNHGADAVYIGAPKFGARAAAVNSLEEATTLIRTPAGFDHDGYKILCKPLLSGNYEITELDPANDQRAS